ncbi:merozoite surface protein-3, putative [Perkinsus marinus ATCC 50983]|uniref:Merozoite surface protein-3, putative n=1 Tax=Perkinsus marinus (strain ATCC 50983 / TXsc) TaxID=423536 RepID=C5LT83_PERM5|nr:merozoite surface protein-3, putative [Perkinsus marinus ATCC 50983]EER00051.1 merozoite surface protein-3, putative [Perkinsus marinus ATCC 50983]|eukprot:XP_002767333.1 merozoite surface protein-3, putative [Perkinsus marinus ATCC 50983]
MGYRALVDEKERYEKAVMRKREGARLMEKAIHSVMRNVVSDTVRRWCVSVARRSRHLGTCRVGEVCDSPMEEKSHRGREEAVVVSEEADEVSEETAEVNEETAEVNEETTEVNEETAEVSEGIVEVSEGTAEVNEETAEVSEETAEVSEGIVEVSEGTAEVNEETAEVSEGIVEVSEGTAEVSEETVEVNEGTAEVSEETAEVSEETAEVSEETAEVSEETAEVSEGTTEVCEGTTKVSEEAGEISEEADGVSAEAENEVRVSAEGPLKGDNPDVPDNVLGAPHPSFDETMTAIGERVSQPSSQSSVDTLKSNRSLIDEAPGELKWEVEEGEMRTASGANLETREDVDYSSAKEISRHVVAELGGLEVSVFDTAHEQQQEQELAVTEEATSFCRELSAVGEVVEELDGGVRSEDVRVAWSHPGGILGLSEQDTEEAQSRPASEHGKQTDGSPSPCEELTSSVQQPAVSTESNPSIIRHANDEHWPAQVESPESFSGAGRKSLTTVEEMQDDKFEKNVAFQKHFKVPPLPLQRVTRTGRKAVRLPPPTRDWETIEFTDSSPE